MPGVLLIETMAQTSGWLVVAVNRFERMAFLAAVKDAKFRMFVTPGQKLSVTAALLHEGSGYAVTQASIALGGKSICDATLTLRVMDFPNHEMRLKMRETAARVGFPAEVPANG
jgi:3-hydroxyacyl-[acyl-carrier-protein] dehydratase